MQHIESQLDRIEQQIADSETQKAAALALLGGISRYDPTHVQFRVKVRLLDAVIASLHARRLLLLQKPSSSGAQAG